jgi:hypothetical protein
LIAVAAAAAHLRRLHARRRHEDTSTETKKEKKSEKQMAKNFKKSGAIGILPFSHSMMLPGYTNLEASSDGILLFIRDTH